MIHDWLHGPHCTVLHEMNDIYDEAPSCGCSQRPVCQNGLAVGCLPHEQQGQCRKPWHTAGAKVVRLLAAYRMNNKMVRLLVAYRMNNRDSAVSHGVQLVQATGLKA